jgi:transposase-like protein
MKMGTEYWVAHVAAAKLEEISGSAYAKRHGISVAALYYWQRKLKATPEIGDPGQMNKFVALRVADAVVARRSPSCTLVMPSGMRLEMLALPAPDWLAALGRAAQGAR